MLYNLEPHRSVTGGAWYQDQDFEAEFVDILNQQSLQFLQRKRADALKNAQGGPLSGLKLACCSVQDVHTFITNLGISKVFSKLSCNCNIDYYIEFRRSN